MYWMPIFQKEWEQITMDFIVGLPATLWKFDYIWVIMDVLTKSAYILPVRANYNAEKFAKI